MAGVKGHRRSPPTPGEPERLKLTADDRVTMMEDLLRRALSEAIPDAQIGASHPDRNKFESAHESLRKFRREVNAVLNAEVTP